MMKRVFWTSTGYVLGLGSSVWVQRRVRRTVQRYTPEQMLQQVADRTRDLTDRARQTVIDLREAATEGRAAMRESEIELHAEFGDRRPRHGGQARSMRDARPSPGATDAPLRPRQR